MIKKLIFTVTLIFTLNTYAYSDLEDCNKYKKLSKDYLNCQKDNLKYKTDKSGVTDGVNTFKSSKTLTEFLKKK